MYESHLVWCLCNVFGLLTHSPTSRSHGAATPFPQKLVHFSPLYIFRRNARNKTTYSSGVCVQIYIVSILRSSYTLASTDNIVWCPICKLFHGIYHVSSIIQYYNKHVFSLWFVLGLWSKAMGSEFFFYSGVFLMIFLCFLLHNV
jgi:hypothetical protein